MVSVFQQIRSCMIILILGLFVIGDVHAYKRFGDVDDKTTIVFIKAVKVGGSTVAGVVRHIGAHHNIKGFDVDLDPALICDINQRRGYVAANHLTYNAISAQLNRCTDVGKPLFVLAWVREPLERCLSDFYHFQVSRHDRAPSSKNKLLYCKGSHQDHYYTYFGGDLKTAQSHTTSTDAFSLYNFVGVAGRFDESMVVLADILGISLKDILYLTAKNSSNPTPTGAKDIRNNMKIHRHPPLSEEPREVREIANSNHFRTSNAWSLKFYNLAQNALDHHIEIMGKDVFARKLAKYQTLLAAVRLHCITRGNVTPKCYYNDHGCGYQCLDKVFNENFA